MMAQHDLCENCAHIDLPDLRSAEGYVRFTTCAALAKSAERCHLCTIIRRGVWSAASIITVMSTIIKKTFMVRMFAAGKSIESRNIPKRQAVRIDSSLFSELVKISVGEVNPNDILLYDSRSAVLEMLTEEGYIPNGVEFRSILTQLLGAATTAFAGNQISRPISDRPLSVESLALLNGWLAECCTSHTMCRTELSLGNMPHRLPMRLVDVSFDKTGRARLIETKRLDLRHVALSYCWGVDHAGQKITASTIARVKQGIHPRKLTRTIQDAITLVRVLDIRYLWGDALCVIQGDETDWQREASMMGMIYANADFTVAATRAEGSSDGFLQTREEHTVALKLPSSAATVFFRESLDAAEEYLKQVGHSPPQGVQQPTFIAKGWIGWLPSPNPIPDVLT
jgi:hypothetical protein